MGDGGIHWVAVLGIHDGKEDEFRRRAAAMIAMCEATEPGQLVYNWSVSPDGRTCHVDERYADLEAAWCHVRGEAVATLMGPLLETCDFAEFWIQSEIADPELRAALSGFGATFWDNWAGRGRVAAA